MKTLQKFICSLLSLSLLLSISNVAAANVESSFSGKIEVDSTSESIDLTNININVYQSIPREETATEWVTEYDETLALRFIRITTACLHSLPHPLSFL